MRLNQPVGIWLLLWPCWWALALAGDAPWTHYLLFAVGAALARAAGCIVNDLTDRKFDREVARTRSRPLASGEVSVRDACALLAVLLLLALGVAMLLGRAAVLWSALALPLVIAYPWMKRITYWPQAFLGLTFNWGALTAWASLHDVPQAPALLLYAAGFFWTLGYDTVYAHQDKEDDALIGVKSTALKLGNATRPFLFVAYGLTVVFLALSGAAQEAGITFYLIILCVGALLAWQASAVRFDHAASCRKHFIAHARLGWLVLIAFLCV